MDAYDRWQAFSTFTIAVVPWLFQELDLAFKLIFLTTILFLSAALYCCRLTKKIYALRKELKEVSEKHSAIVKRFNEKRVVLDRYRAGFLSMDHLISVALQATKQDRLQILYKGFLSIREQISDNE